MEGHSTPGVCMVLTSFYPQVGGMQTYTLSMARHLMARGVPVAIVTRRLPDTAEYEELDGLPIYRVVAEGKGKVRTATGFIVAALRQIWKLRGRCRIVHAHQVISPATVGLLARDLMGMPVVINPHSARDGGGISILLNKRAWSGRPRLAWMRARGDAFVCISRQVRCDLMELGFPPERLHYIPNGVDVSRFSPAPARERDALRERLGLPVGPLVTFVGTLCPVKNVDVLLRAWRSVSAAFPSAHLIVLGDGPERNRLEGLAVELGVAARVHFRGRVDNVEEYLRCSTVHVLPSQHEGLPMAVLEAMSSALPVVATGVGGNVDAITDGVEGLLVPPGDVDALADALGSLLDDPDLAVAMGQRARERVLREFSLDAIGDRLIALYRQLAAATMPRG